MKPFCLFRPALLLCAFASLSAWLITPIASRAETTDEARLRRNLLVRDRFADFEPTLRAAGESSLKKLQETFINGRTQAIATASQSIASDFGARMQSGRQDANQIKVDPSFTTKLRETVKGVIAPANLTKESEAWSKNAEAEAREIMSHCLQSVIAQDLGLHFDETHRGKLVAAVQSIKIADLAKKADTVEIEKMILDTLPDAAISSTARAAISTAVQALVNIFSAGFVAAKCGPATPVVMEVINFTSGALADYALAALNTQLTAKPDPKLIEMAMTKGLIQWHEKAVTPELRQAIEKFHEQLVADMEQKIRSEHGLLPLQVP